MHDQLAAAAREAGLELTWSRRISYSRYALVAAETVRIIQPESHQAFLAASSTPTSHSPRTLKIQW
jgi:hypothetical protein